MKGRERRRGGRTGSATAWRSAGRRATGIGEKRRKSNETGRNRRKLNGSAAVGRGGARGLRRRDRPAPPSRSRVAPPASGRRSAGRSQRPKSGKAEARPKNRFGDRVATGGASGRWNRRKKTENEGNRPKSGGTEGIGRCRVRRSARPSSPGPTCSPELVGPAGRRRDAVPSRRPKTGKAEARPKNRFGDRGGQRAARPQRRREHSTKTDEIEEERAKPTEPTETTERGRAPAWNPGADRRPRLRSAVVPGGPSRRMKGRGRRLRWKKQFGDRVDRRGIAEIGENDGKRRKPTEVGGN